MRLGEKNGHHAKSIRLGEEIISQSIDDRGETQ